MRDNKKQFVQAVLVAPSGDLLQRAAEHLRYWPFVKAYQHCNDTVLVAVLYLGDKPVKKPLHEQLAHAANVVERCLAQYGVEVLGPWADHRAEQLVFLEEDVYMRPHCTLKSLSEFMDPLLNKNRWSHGK